MRRRSINRPLRKSHYWRSVTRGLGAGGEVEIGKAAAEADRNAIARIIGDMDLIILVVALVGARAARQLPS